MESGHGEAPRFQQLPGIGGNEKQIEDEYPNVRALLVAMELAKK
jgi:hypothetical protein